MKIAILLPYKENFSPEYPGAVSLFVYETTKKSKFKKDITVFGNKNFSKRFKLRYKNIELKKKPFTSQTKNYVKKFINLEKRNNSTIIEIQKSKKVARRITLVRPNHPRVVAFYFLSIQKIIPWRSI